MTPPDPFSPEGASHYDADVNPAYEQYYSQPAHAAMPGGAPAVRGTTDGLSVGALVAGLLGGGPIAVVLGLRRTANGMRTGRGLAWAGLILGVLGTLALIAAVVLLVWAGGQIRDELSVLDDAPQAYGDDPHLDALWDDCEAGDMVACDDLYFVSPRGSDYEAFGDNCGTQGRGIFQPICDSRTGF